MGAGAECEEDYVQFGRDILFITSYRSDKFCHRIQVSTVQYWSVQYSAKSRWDSWYSLTKKERIFGAFFPSVDEVVILVYVYKGILKVL